jgi:hypothetical protein
MSKARLDHLTSRLDGFDERLRRIEEAVIRIDERLSATLPHLATKADLARIEAVLPTLAIRAELADKPSRPYMWGVMAALTGADTATLAAIGVPLTYLPHHGTAQPQTRAECRTVREAPGRLE